MRPAWRLATNSLTGRRLRTALLSAAVALSAALITAVACGMTSVGASLERRLDDAIGRADARLAHVGGRSFGIETARRAAGWDEVAAAAPRAVGPLPLRNMNTADEVVASGQGVAPGVERTLRDHRMAAGRFVESTGEVVLGAGLAEDLSAGVGDYLRVVRFGEPIELQVVGVAEARRFSELSRPEAFVTIEQLEAVTGRPGQIARLDIVLADPRGVDAFIERRESELPKGLILEPTERISSGLDQNVRANQIGLLIWSVLALLASGFIILTGLTTAVAERQRELAIVRCVGGSKGQIGVAQLLVGAIIGALGALAGVPLGIALAWVASRIWSEQLPAGLVIPPRWIALAVVGSVLSGLFGAVWPAARAAAVSPLEALTVRARALPARVLVALGVFGLACVALQPILAYGSDDGQIVYWTYTFVGAPVMFLGWFLLGAPAIALVARAVGPVLAKALRVPAALLVGGMTATPVRHGFTAGSLMAGLALLTAIWTSGRSLLDDWLGAIEFPDAFVHGVAGLPDDAQYRIESLPFVNETNAISMLNVSTGVFGVRALRPIDSTFIAFEPEPFFRMTALDWVEGDPETAKRRMSEGGAILVAREFAVARGLGPGDTFTLEREGESFDFEIVGVIDSPGLDLVSKYFDVGEQYRDQALHAVFGSRRDMVEKFGNDAVRFLQIDLDDSVSDEEALEGIRAELRGTLLSAGSGRAIKDTISGIGRTSLTVVSSVAVAAMLIACFGVANVVVAGIQSRTFEFGVVRAVGASGPLLARLILAEVILVALTAGLIGTLMGVQASWASARLYALLAGIELTPRPPVKPIAIGWGIMFALTLAAAAPAALGLARRKPRELLASVRG